MRSLPLLLDFRDHHHRHYRTITATSAASSHNNSTALSLSLSRLLPALPSAPPDRGLFRSGASLAGNLATASPISDMNPLLACLGASLSLASFDAATGAVAFRTVRGTPFPLYSPPPL